MKQALGALAHDENPNATLAAIGAGIPAPDGWSRTAAVPFSSARKWSAASFGSHGTWVIGAPEMVLPDPSVTARAEADELASQGRRVLMLACSDAALLIGNNQPQARYRSQAGQRDVFRHPQIFRADRDALRLQFCHLIEERLRIEHHAIADHREFGRPQYAGG